MVGLIITCDSPDRLNGNSGHCGQNTWFIAFCAALVGSSLRSWQLFQTFFSHLPSCILLHQQDKTKEIIDTEKEPSFFKTFGMTIIDRKWEITQNYPMSQQTGHPKVSQMSTNVQGFLMFPKLSLELKWHN